MTTEIETETIVETEPTAEARKEARMLENALRTDVNVTGMTYHQKIDAIAPHINGPDGWYKRIDGTPIIISDDMEREITAEDAQYLVSKNARVHYTDSSGTEKVLDTIDTRWLSHALDWYDAPVIRRTTYVPYFNSRWDLVDKEGYDPVSQMYYIDRGIKIEEVDLETAKQVLKKLTKSMLFKDPTGADYANYIGFLLTPMIQTALKTKMAPFHMFRKNQRGTGATTAVNVLGYLYYNEPVQTYAIADKLADTEIRKTITACMRINLEALNFDDITGTLDRMPIVQYLTSGVWTDRKLQESTMLVFPNPSMLMIGTGNNVFIGGDMARRTVIIEFYSDLEHPELRQMDPDNLPAFIRENRGLILGSLAALIKNWDKEPGEDKIGDFKEWSTTISGILRDAGIPGFQDNRAQIRVLDLHASEMGTWLEALYNWQQSKYHIDPKLIDTGIWTAGDLISQLKEDEDLRNIVPLEYEKGIPEILQGNTNRASRMLTKMLNQNRGGYVLICDSNKKTKTFCVKMVKQMALPPN
jgi:hypothetical protein